jgi:hypothetical protein
LEGFEQKSDLLRFTFDEGCLGCLPREQTFRECVPDGLVVVAKGKLRQRNVIWAQTKLMIKKNGGRIYAKKFLRKMEVGSSGRALV